MHEFRMKPLVLLAFNLMNTVAQAKLTFWQPSEDAPHAATLMTWPTAHSLAGDDLNATREELANIANTIAKYEPLILLVQEDGDRGSDLSSAEALLGSNKNITLHPTPDVDSLWARDTGPVFVYSNDGPVDNIYFGPIITPGVGFRGLNTSSETVGIGLNFNHWGRKNSPSQDAYVAAITCEVVDKSSYHAPFTAEGGALEVDGEGTLMATESSILNPNRNPGVDKETIEGYFRDIFGVVKTIWLAGSAGTDITDDHVDGLARFGANGTILLSKPFGYDTGEADAFSTTAYENAKAVIENSTDARGRPFQVVEIQEPDISILGLDADPNDGPSVSYVNYYVVNGAVIIPRFGDEVLDESARRIIQQQFPDRKVEQVSLRELGIQGGGIHCATQQILA